jgi:hypothetical protein
MWSGVIYMEDTVIRNNIGSGVRTSFSDIRCVGSTTNSAGAWGNSKYGVYSFDSMNWNVPSPYYVQSQGCDFGTGADDNSLADIHLYRGVSYGADLPTTPPQGDGVNTQFSFIIDPTFTSYPATIRIYVSYTLAGVSSTEEVFSDSGTSGALSSSFTGGSGSIVYSNGYVAVALSSAPDAGTLVYVDRLYMDNDYDYGDDETFFCALSTGECL